MSSSNPERGPAEPKELVGLDRAGRLEGASPQEIMETDRPQQTEQASHSFAALVDPSEDAIIGKTPEGTITSWNRGASQLYGYESEEIVGKHIAVLYPKERLGELEAIMETIREGEHVHPFETVRKTKNGQDVNIRLSVSPILDSQGAVVAATAVARDVTLARKAAEALLRSENELQRLNARLEELVRERTQQLEAANKELETFAYSVSHDLRAPLRAIDGFSAAVAEENREQLNDRGQHYLNRVRAGVQRMNQLIDDLLELSRVSRAEIQSTPMDVSACAQEIASDLQHAHADRQLEMIVAPGLTAHADPRLLRIALENLLGNSWKFTRRTPQPRVEFGQREMEGQAWFFVRDNGAGFDMTYAHKLFGPFQRLHSVQEYEGTGIGLATVQRIIRRHGGSVRGEGMPGQGATFYFTLGPAPSENPLS